LRIISLPHSLLRIKSQWLTFVMCGASAHTVAVPFRIPTGFTILHQLYTKLMALRQHIHLNKKYHSNVYLSSG